MADETITLVCGFGRCGTSLVMQMLEAGGMPVIGEYPAFEASDIVRPQSIDTTRLPSINGHALKLLDPQRYTIPPGISTRAIWCRRDPDQQAKSHAKFLREWMGLPMNMEQRDRLARAFKVDAKFAICALREAGVTHIIDLRFEDVISNPHVAAEQISRFCGGLDAEKMAAVVHARSPDCAPDMSLEVKLIEDREKSNAAAL